MSLYVLYCQGVYKIDYRYLLQNIGIEHPIILHVFQKEPQYRTNLEESYQGNISLLSIVYLAFTDFE